eukprot:380594-Pelagomonas_calceolata.AAC.4
MAQQGFCNAVKGLAAGEQLPASDACSRDRYMKQEMNIREHAYSKRAFAAGEDLPACDACSRDMLKTQERNNWVHARKNKCLLLVSSCSKDKHKSKGQANVEVHSVRASIMRCAQQGQAQKQGKKG